jgi:hypothetical protein
MSIWFKTEQIGLTQSDEAYSVKTGSVEGSGNGYADTDTSSWGEPLSWEKGSYRFTKKYLNITFVVGRDNYTDFQNVRNGQVWIEGTNKTAYYNFPALGDGMYLSKTDDASSDKEVILRVRIPT